MQDLKHLRLDMFSNWMPKVKYELNHALKDDGGAIRIDVKIFLLESLTLTDTKKGIKYYKWTIHMYNNAKCES